MKSGWKARKLDDVVESTMIGLVRNKTQQRDDLPYHYVKMNNISNDNRFDPAAITRVEANTDEVERFQLRDGDLLFNTRNSHELVGKSCVYRSIGDAPVLFNNNVMRIRFATDLSSEFAGYAFSSEVVSEQLKGMVSGTTNVAGIYYKHLKDLILPFPPLPEQRRIVAILDEAFAAIATAKQNAEKNLQNARALFESHLNAVFTQRGEGWVETTVGEQAVLQRGFDITKREQNPGKVPVVSSGGIKSFHDKAMAKGPGVVIGRKGTLGKVFYLEQDYWPHDTTLWVKDFKKNDPRFVYYFFISLDVLHLDSGTANPALNRNQVHPIEVNWPPVNDQPRIAATLDGLHEETQRLESIYQRKLTALDELKKSLLHQAFSGELTGDSKSSERALEEAGV